MAELRWILLLAGLLFMAGLTAWEMRRPRQGRRDALNASGRSDPEFGTMASMADASMTHEPSAAPAHAYSAHAYPARAYEERVPLEAPVHVDLPPLEPPLVVSFDEPVLIHEAPLPILEPVHALPADEIRFEAPRPQPAHTYEERAEEAMEEAPAVLGPLAAEEQLPVEPLVAEVSEESVALPAAEPVTLIVEWPPETQRHIISVRVVGVSPERMSGRPLRQALAACGFVHGRFGIFHQPGADGRALISAANLSKPGVFDPASMDFQRFRGLGLFAVLPGPLPPAAALDHLLDTAGDLAQRLQARVQDEHGMPLDEERLEELARVVHGMSHGALRQEPAA